MTRNFTIAISICLAVLLHSCVTAKIESNKDASYTKHPKNIFILVNTASEASGFTANFLYGLRQKFGAKGIASTVHIRKALSFETEEDVNKMVTDYGPDAVMLIKQSEVHSTNNMVDGGKFEITLLDFSTRKPIWKGDFSVTGSMGLLQAVQKSVDTLVKKMEADKLM